MARCIDQRMREHALDGIGAVRGAFGGIRLIESGKMGEQLSNRDGALVGRRDFSIPGWGEAGVYSTTRDLLKWYRALSSGGILSRDSVNDLFAPVAPIGEGQTALGWFLGKSGNGATYIFTRGNEDWGPNSLLYAYPESGVVIVVLTHAGDSTGDLSWSRLIHSKIQELLFP